MREAGTDTRTVDVPGATLAVDVLAGSGGAVNALAWVAAHPDDVRILVAHEPPLLARLPGVSDPETAYRPVVGGFAGPEQGRSPDRPVAFAARLAEVLAGAER